MSRKRTALLACLMPLALSACATNTTDPDSYCLIAAPIFYSSEDDSAETVAQIEAHNSRWECVCNADCPDE